MLRTFLAPLVLLAVGWAPPSTLEPLREEAAPLYEVGSSKVRGSKLEPFDARWKGSGGAEISEVATLEKVDGKRCYVWRQEWPMQGGQLSIHSELVMDAKTLATISFQKQVMGLPPGAGIGQRPTFMRWEYDGADYTLTTRVAGQEATAEGTLPLASFEGAALGLVLAALPLKQDYSARLPVAMSLGLTSELTTYMITARVVGTEKIAVPGGRELKAWVVAVDWADLETEVISSKGGAEEAGGAYYVVAKPPKGLPHVLRYRNEGTSIDLLDEDSAE